MASESSSAVLDLNDGDVTEDTEPPSVTDNDNEGIPLIMEHGYDIAVKVDAPLKQLSTLETYVTYRVRCVCARWPAPPAVRRRYNHFRVLHNRLSQSHPLIAIPPLPPRHSARQQLDRYSPGFVQLRALALNAFLTRVAKHPILTHSPELRTFLTCPDDQLASAFRSESGLSLRALSGKGDARAPARVKDPEFTSAADYLTSLQQKLTALCALTVKLHKGSAAMGNELTGMKRLCDAWATQSGAGWVCRGAGACGAGAGAAGAARARAGAGLRARATLPQLAAYCQAHVEKIKQRDNLHASYVSGNNTAGDLHNRLEQASEALRSDLSDWIPKTRSEIKSTLLELAERQVNIHSQTLLGWEHALKLSTEANVDELFKTVSKTAVANLSPSKYAATPETDRDFDDIDSNDSSEISKVDSEMSKVDNDFEVSKDSMKTDSHEVSSDPLKEFSEVDLSS
ncbi:hypothetical protein ABMA28_013158 [Loxostege sticticalis]|uniref:PX domain-containing protein n=1 Tax=Loxostege sticticalis TaxID=481309 RepID=A0ABD0S3S4_LOXSC